MSQIQTQKSQQHQQQKMEYEQPEYLIYSQTQSFDTQKSHTEEENLQHQLQFREIVQAASQQRQITFIQLVDQSRSAKTISERLNFLIQLKKYIIKVSLSKKKQLLLIKNMGLPKILKQIMRQKNRQLMSQSFNIVYKIIHRVDDHQPLYQVIIFKGCQLIIDLAIEMLYMSKQKTNQMAITVLLHLVGRRYNQAIDALFTDDLLYQIYEVVVTKKLTGSYKHLSQIIIVALSSNPKIDHLFSQKDMLVVIDFLQFSLRNNNQDRSRTKIIAQHFIYKLSQRLSTFRPYFNRMYADRLVQTLRLLVNYTTLFLKLFLWIAQYMQISELDLDGIVEHLVIIFNNQDLNGHQDLVLIVHHLCKNFQELTPQNQAHVKQLIKLIMNRRARSNYRYHYGLVCLYAQIINFRQVFFDKSDYPLILKHFLTICKGKLFDRKNYILKLIQDKIICDVLQQVRSDIQKDTRLKKYIIRQTLQGFRQEFIQRIIDQYSS